MTIAAFGPAMTRVAARLADEVVLNLVSAEHVAEVRDVVAEEAAAAGRRPPRLAVWVPTALDPGPGALAQLSGQLAVYLGAPGYGELFTKLGFGSLVERARTGERRAALAEAIPYELLASIGAVGTRDEVEARIAAYHRAGADQVAVVPSTAEAGPDQVFKALARAARAGALGHQDSSENTLEGADQLAGRRPLARGVDQPVGDRLVDRPDERHGHAPRLGTSTARGSSAASRAIIST